MIQISRRRRNQQVLIDLGTANLLMAAVEYSQTDKPTIVGIYRKHRLPSVRSNVRDFQSRLMHELKDLFTALQKEHPDFSPLEIHYGLTAPYYTAETVKVRQVFEESHVITEDDMENIKSRGVDTFLEHFKHPSAVAVFEVRPLEQFLNGYPTHNIVGRSGTELALTMRYAAAHQMLIHGFQDLSLRFHTEVKTVLHTFPQLYADMFHENILDHGVQVIVDIGGELSEVVILEGGIIQNVYTLPVGVLDLTEEIARLYRTDFESGEVLWRKYIANRLEPGEEGKIDEILRTIVINWKPHFEMAFREMPSGSRRSLNIFLVGGGALLADVQALIMSLEVMEKMIVPPQMHQVDPKAFQDKVNGYEHFEGAGDFGILSLLLRKRE